MFHSSSFALLLDIIQMTGRAGRPKKDNRGTAIVFAHSTKQKYYQEVLCNPLTVES